MRNPPILKICPQCAKEFKAFVSQNRVFCSRECKYIGCISNPHNRGFYLNPDNFWANVEKGGGCWEWQGHRNKAGYGHIGLNNALVLAHRHAWSLACGPIPDGLLVLHDCDNPPCVRIDHLYLGTSADNAHDRSARGRGANTKGERHATGKLTEEIVLRIRSRRLAGEKRRPIADEYGVSVSSIYSIEKRRVWRHI